MAIRVQIEDEVGSISRSTNTLGKGMNLIITGSLALLRQPVQEKENSEFKPVKLCLKIDLVSHTAYMERLVNTCHFCVCIYPTPP